MGDRCPSLKQLPPFLHHRMLRGAVTLLRSAWLGVSFTVITGWKICSVTVDLGPGSSSIHSQSSLSVLSILECAQYLAASAFRTLSGTSSVAISLAVYSPRLLFRMSLKRGVRRCWATWTRRT